MSNRGRKGIIKVIYKYFATLENAKCSVKLHNGGVWYNVGMKKKRIYRVINQQEIANFKATRLLTNNNTEAVQLLEPTRVVGISARATKINRKVQESNVDYVDKKLQEIAVNAVERVQELVGSEDESIATRNSHFVIDHVRGKALQRTENKNLNITIEDILN